MNTGKRKSKLSNDDKKAILLEYELNHTNENIKAICNNYLITKRTLYDIVNKYKSENSIIDYSSNFTEKANIIISKMLERIEKQVQDPNEKIQLSQLVTSLGILYDKMRLNSDKSTSNSSININIKIE